MSYLCGRFALEGDHIPRILPCTHTLCEKCIGNILQRNTEDCNLLECPECKKKHPAQDRARSFPQNKFLLPVIRRKANTQKNVTNREGQEVCERHGRAISLYCNNPECQKSICNLCMLEEHRAHYLVDLQQFQEEKQKILMKKLQSLKTDLKSNRDSLMEIKSELNENLENCKRKIKEAKEKKIAAATQIIAQKYDEVLQSLTGDQQAKGIEYIDKDVVTIDSNILTLESIGERIHLMATPLEDLIQAGESFMNIVSGIKKQAGSRSYTILDYNDGQLNNRQMTEACGDICRKTLHLDVMESMDLHMLASASQLNGTVTRSVVDGLRQISCLCSLPDGGVVLGGRSKSGKEELVKYNLNTGEQECEETAWYSVTGTSIVNLDGKCCIAVSFREKKRLQFRAVNNLQRVVYDYSYPSLRRYVEYLCTATPSTLLCVDPSKEPNEVGWIDCSTSPPKTIHVIRLHTSKVLGVCYAMYNRKDLVVYCCDEGISAVNARSTQNEWSILKTSQGRQIKPCSITTDGRGRIFTSDTENACILMLSIDGTEMGTVLDLKDIGKPGPICWCENSSSIIVPFQASNKWSVAEVTLGKVF